MAGTGAPWRSIRDDIAAGIVDGRWPVGSRLPSYRELAASWRVGVGPVQRAIRELRASGVLRGEQGVGVTVVREPTAADLGPRSLEDRVAELEAWRAELERRERGE